MILRTHYKYLQFSIITLIIILLTGCSTRVKSEKDIIADLQANAKFISDAVEICDYEIIKRQTNTDAKTDIVYLTVHTDAPEIRSTLTYELTYELYNEGWVLESIMRYKDGPWEFSGLPDSQLLTDIENNDYYFSEWELDIEDFEIIAETYESTDKALYKKQITINLTAHNTLFDYYSSYNVYYEVVDGAWELQNIEIANRKYTPTFSPNITASDRIVEELKLGSGVSATEYDSYEYLKTETDWQNCTEIRYYTATKSWWFGIESYLITIPLYFSLENGDDSSKWTYRSSEIESSIQSVDWSIEGTWANESDSYYPYASVNMRISSLTATDDPETYTADLFCDAGSSEYPYLCRTYGNVDTNVRFSSPGRWVIYIDDTVAELNSGRAWYAFELIGYSVGATYEGFWWKFTTDSLGCQLYRV